MDRIRLGYVGCGYMAQNVHIPNFSSIPGCELLALAEVRRELGRKVQARLGIPRLYTDHQTLLADPDLDAVCVSADFSVQSWVALEALQAGKHVFMEKPMATSLKRADAMVAAAARAGKQLMVGHMKRYDAGNELVKAHIDRFRGSGELGPITYVRSHGSCGDWTAGLDVYMDRTDEPYPEAVPIGPDWLPREYLARYQDFIDQATHLVNLLRWLLDCGDDAGVRLVDLNDDGFTGVAVFMMGGVRALLELGNVSHYRWDEHTQVYFRDGWIHTWAPPLLLKQVPAEVEIYRAGKEQTFIRPIPQPEAWTWSYKREAEHFIHCVQAGERVRTSGQDTRTDVRLLEDTYRVFLADKGLF